MRRRMFGKRVGFICFVVLVIVVVIGPIVAGGCARDDIGRKVVDNSGPIAPMDVAPAIDRIQGAAIAENGRATWSEGQWDSQLLEGGVIGCAAAVSVMLERAGAISPEQGRAGVINLVRNLTDSGWTEDSNLANVQPADVIYGDNGGSDQHIGIVLLDPADGQLKIANNNSYPSNGNPTPNTALDPFESAYIVTHYGNNASLVHPPRT